jgi:hypothetical protein
MKPELLNFALAANTAHGLVMPDALRLAIGAAELLSYATMYLMTQKLMFERFDRLEGRLLDWSWTTSEIASGLAVLNTFVCCIVNELIQGRDHSSTNVALQFGLLAWTWVVAGIVYLVFPAQES